MFNGNMHEYYIICGLGTNRIGGILMETLINRGWMYSDPSWYAGWGFWNNT